MNKLPLLLVRLHNRLVHKAPTLACCSSTNDTALRWSTTATTAAATEASNESSSSSSSSFMNKERILESALKQVPFYGWTQDAIVVGIQQMDLSLANNEGRGRVTSTTTASLSMAGLFTPRDLVHFHMDHCNKRLRQELPLHLLKQNDTTTTTRRAVSCCTVEDKIASAFQLRLEYSKNLIENNRWHEGMALGVSSSDQAWTTTEQLKEIVNIVVDAVIVIATVMPPEQDDTNNNEPTTRIVSELERIALGGIYVATELHMLTDTSPNYQDTWDFLRQRMNEWKIISSSSSAFSNTGAAVRVGDALTIAKTLSTAFASAAASVLQVDPSPFSMQK